MITKLSPKAFPDYLSIRGEQLGVGTPVQVRVGGSMADLARDMAHDMLRAINSAKQIGRELTMIAPVGPIDQYPLLAELLNKERIDCRNVMIINMDEYLTDDDQWIDIEHPLSFRGYMDRKFYDLLDDELAPLEENRIFPNPNHPDEIQQLIIERGGVDVTYGGIGINGHIAFNEPDESVDIEEFSEFSTRVLNLTPHTRTINSYTVGGEIDIIPNRAVTVGMKEILSSSRIHLYCNRPWQSSVVRRVLHGPISAACPSSLLRLHNNTVFTLANYVAAIPNIGLK